MLYILSTLSQKIEEWNESINNFVSTHMDNSFYGGVIALLLFIFACWGISYFTKK